MNLDLKSKLINLFKLEVSYLQYINCFGCESFKTHIHSYYPGEYNLKAINKLFDTKQITVDDFKWLKQCYVKEN